MGGPPSTPDRLSRLDSWVRRHPAVPDGLLAVVLAAAVAPTTVDLLRQADAPGWVRTSTILLVVAGHGAVAGRRWRPVAAYLVGCTMMLALVVLTVPYDLVVAPTAEIADIPAILLPSALIFPVLLYAVVLYARGRAPALAMTVAALGAVIVAVRITTSSELLASLGPGPLVVVLVALVAAVVAPWSLAQLRRTRTAYAAELEERAARTERQRIAREMHDVVAHSLSVMVAQAEAGRMIAARDSVRAVEVLETIAVTGRAAMGDMRGLLGVLRADDSTDVAVAGPQPTLAALPELIDRVNDAGLPATLSIEGDPVDLGRRGELAAYRVIQEALTNVVKHAGPGARAAVEMRWSEHALSASVLDDGVGVTQPSPSGHGLVGMRERAADLGGTVRAEPRREGGYAVHLRIPATERSA